MRRRCILLLLALALCPAPPLEAAPWRGGGPDIGWVISLLRPQGPSGPLYAGTYAGGVFRSDDGGLHWRSASTNMVDAVVWDLEAGQDPVGSLYAATEDRAMMRSDLQASFWTPINTGLNDPFQPDVQAVEVQPDDPFSIIAATGNGMMGSHDRGNVWPDSLKWLSGFSFADAEISPVAPRTYFGLQRSSIYVSRSRREVFEEINQGLSGGEFFMDLELWPGSTDSMLAADFDGSLYQLRGGSQWVEIGPASALGQTLRLYVSRVVDRSTPPGPVSLGSNALAADARGTDALAADAVVTDPWIFVGADRGLYRSDDRGLSWSQIPGLSGRHDEIWSILVDDPATAQLMLGSFTRGFLSTGSDGLGWQPHNDGLQAAWVLSLWASGAEVLAGTAHGRLFRSQDTARTWSDVSGDLDVLRLQTVHRLAQSGRWLVGSVEGIWYSDDEGGHWTKATVSGARERFHQFLQPDWMDPLEILVGSEAGVLRSTDGGSSWSPLPGLADVSSNFFAMAAAGDSTVCFAADRDALWIGRYADHYDRVVPPPPLTRTVRALRFLSADGRRLVVGGNSEFINGDGALYRAQWDGSTGFISSVDLSRNVGPSPIFVSGVEWDEARGQMYVGLDEEGVFRSDDEGSSWSDLNEGLVSRRIQCLVRSVGDAGRLLAGTLARGAYVRPLGDEVAALLQGPWLEEIDEGVRIRFASGRRLHAELSRAVDGATARLIWSGEAQGDVEFVDGAEELLGLGGHQLRYDLRLLEGSTELARSSASLRLSSGARILRTRLRPNFPNPFNPSTALEVELAEAGELSLRIYDLRGRLVRRLFEAPAQAGLHRFHFDGLDQDGDRLPSGVYLVRMSHHGRHFSQRISLVR